MPVVAASVICTSSAVTSSAVKLAGFSGSFRATCGHGSAGSNGKAVKLEWDSVEPVKILTGKITLSGSDWHHASELPDVVYDLRESWFPPTARGSIVLQTNPLTYASHTVKLAFMTPDDGLFTWERKLASYEKQSSPASLALEAAASHLTTLTHGQAPNDVCLDFVQLGRQLWTTEASLINISPLFEDILSSEFAEGTSSVAELSSKPVEKASYEFEDSDAETDVVNLVSSRKKDQQKPLAPFKRIPIKDVLYSTYLAVVVWAHTGHITFAPLLSSFRRTGVDHPAVVAARQDAVRTLAEAKSPLLPLPVSPKSVYRLADYLSHGPLKSVALANLVSQLTPTNAIDELFGDVATVYPAVRDAILSYVVDNWAKVKDEPATKLVESRASELPPGAVSTALLLARRLAEIKR
ncbi:hypothetical protein JCM9279_004418 [Rhodotorula babjevae]